MDPYYPPLPGYVQIEPVGQCNLRCQMCAIQFRRDGPPYGPPAMMAYDTFTRLVDQWDGLSELHLQGLGEPMMHPRFFEMVEYATARGVAVSANTNLTLLTVARAERCVRSGLSSLHCSVDAPSAATYERIRQGAKFDRVVTNLRGLVAAKQRLQSATPRLRLVMVIMRQNLEELPELVRCAAAWGMEAMFVQHLAHDFAESTLPSQYRPMREFVDEQTLLHQDETAVERVFSEARQAAESAGLSLRLPRTRPKPWPEHTPGRQRCDWPWRGGYISYDGRAMPCCMVSTPDRANFGDMAREGVQAIWNGAPYAEFRRQLDSAEPPEVCRTCSLYRGTF